MRLSTKIDLTACRKQCKSCHLAYLKKHLDTTKKELVFDVECTGIPTEYVSSSLAENVGISKEQLLTVVDPVEWVSRNLTEVTQQNAPLVPRDYQAEMLRCTSRFKVLRTGRRVGKTHTMAMWILYKIFTVSHFRVVVVGPQNIHVAEIFKKLREMTQYNPVLAASISRQVSQPYTFELYNGSRVIGFVAGTTDARKDAGVSIRGQGADLLILDEFDYMAPSTFDAAIALITETNQAMIWAASTPKLDKGRLFEICSDPMWKEFYIPATQSPNWSPALERRLRTQYTAVGYRKEVLAEFSTEEKGLYRHKFVSAAKKDYSYDDMTYNPNWTYCMGVDWNDRSVGVFITVVGWDPLKERFVKVHDGHVARDDHDLQLAATERIVELNRLFRPAWIYADAGYGGVQISLLRKYGMDSIKRVGPKHPDARLKDIVKAYDFGSSVEIRDPWDKSIIKRNAKGFLVDNSIRIFEKGEIIFSKYDTRLEKQLLGYAIHHYTPTGQEVYEQSDKTVGDHALDSLNLALVAFAMEFSELGRPKYLGTIMTIDGGILTSRSGSSNTRISPIRDAPPVSRTTDDSPVTVGKPVKQYYPGVERDQDSTSNLRAAYGASLFWNRPRRKRPRLKRR